MIRRARPDDMKRIAALDRVAWRANRKSEYIPDGEHAWRVWIDAAHVLVAERDGEIAGCALAFLALDSSLCLHKIFVASDAQGAGLGRDLLTEMLAVAGREQREIWLTVDPVNARARSLYESLGFQVRASHDRYYGDGEPRHVMACRP